MDSNIVIPSTLVELLRWRALHQPEQQAYTFLADGETEEKSLTYRELDQQAQAIAARLQSLGIAGEHVLLLHPPGLEYIAAFFGCLYAGVVAVPTYPPRLNRSNPRLQAITQDAQTTIALTTASILSKVERRLTHTPELQTLHWLATDSIAADSSPGSGQALSEKWQEPMVSGDTLALLQYTSGSTATPKGVMVSHANLLHNQQMIQAAFGHTEHSRVVGWLPVYHDMGLIGNVLQPLYLGSPCILMSPMAFLQQPVRWLQAITRYQAHTSGGPNFAYDLCVRKVTPEQRATLDLSRWSIAFNGSEPIRQETLERFAEAFAPCGFRREAFYPCYGLAEATLIVSGGQESALPTTATFQTTALEQNRVIKTCPENDDTRTLVGSGQTLLKQKIVIVDPETATSCPTDQIGEIWVAGPSVAQGYWGRPEETRHTFQAYLADTEEGPFLRTGDLGFLEDNELFITGRLKDMIIIRGRNHHPQDIELTVEKSHPALRPGCGAAFSVEVDDDSSLEFIPSNTEKVRTGEQLVVVQEVKRSHRKADMTEVVEAIRQAVAEEHELHVYAVMLIKPGSIPKTSSGKIQRHVCRAKFLTDKLEAIGQSILAEAESTGSEESLNRAALLAVAPLERQPLLEAYLQQQMARVFRIAPSQLDAQKSLSGLGVDSLMAVELQHEIETNLGVVLPMVDFLQGSSIARLASQILAELTAPATPPLFTPVEETGREHLLSHGQRAMWFLHRMAPESAAYHIAKAVRIQATLDIPALQRAFQRLVDRHPSLRTTFPAPNGEPVQHIHDQVEVCFQAEDGATWSEASLNQRLNEETNRPFDLESGPLLRVHLFRRSAQEHVLLMVVHHIVADFWSLAVLVRELGVLYSAERAGMPASLPPLASQYVDYVHWQMDMLAGLEGERLQTYWQKQLTGKLSGLDLFTNRPRPLVQSYRGAAQGLRLSGGLLEGLKTLSRDHGATLYMTLLATFQILLYRYTGQENVLVGSPTAGRKRAKLAGLVGYFVNPVVIRADLAGNPPFRTFLDRVRQTVLEAFAHQEYPFALLVEQLRPDRDLSRSPIFQVMFTMQQSPFSEMKALASFALGGTETQMNLGDLSLQTMALSQQAAQFDLTLVMAEVEDSLACSLEYNRDLFEAGTVERMLGHFQTLLEGIVAEPERRLSDLPLLTTSERKQVLQSWNGTRADYDQALCLSQLFETQAERTPDAPAVIFAGEHLTYGELNHRANQVAHYLRKRGVEPEVLVGVCMVRSIEMVIGLLGVLKAGGAYVPLDPTHPADRIALVLEDAQAPVLITQRQLLESLPEYSGDIVCLDTAWAVICHEKREGTPSSYLNADNLAYVIYTSGSTGRPKGVQITHRAVVNFLHSMRQQPGLTKQDVLLSVTTLSFDIAALEIFLPLTSGASVELVSHEVASNGKLLSRQLADSSAAMMQATPATWQLLLETGWPGDKQLRILCGGEALLRELADRLVVKSDEVWNMYGPTETTIWSAIYPVETGEGPVSIGRPIANTQIYLLDKHLNPVPVGVPGELYIGGDGLARGYLNRPELTAEKFIPNPFVVEKDEFRRMRDEDEKFTSHPFGCAQGRFSSLRLYKTGDLARYTSDGNIEFLGRLDHQVKIRGFRIELGEIETVLDQHPAVQQAVVVAQADTVGGKRLVGYIVPNQEPAPTVSELRRFLLEKLPDYMLPSAFIVLKALPLTPNGKVNRRALPVPEGVRPELAAAYIAPKSEMEQTIARIWQKVLQVEKAGIHDNFFELGGHSLLMAQVHSQLQEKIVGRELTIVEMFQYPTIHALAKYISQKQSEQPTLLSQERVELRSTRSLGLRQQRRRRQKSRVIKRQ